MAKHQIKTDYISVDPPASERPFQKMFDHMLTKPKYDKNATSTKPWEPKVNTEKILNNRSSVKHNIISHRKNEVSGAINLGLLDK